MLRKIDDNGFFVEDILDDIIPYLKKTVIDIVTNEDGTTYESTHEEIVTHEIYGDDEELIGCEPTLDPHYISVPCLERFYLPRWNGTHWVEGLTNGEIDAINNATHGLTPEEKLDELATNVNDALYAIMMLSIE